MLFSAPSMSLPATFWTALQVINSSSALWAGVLSRTFWVTAPAAKLTEKVSAWLRRNSLLYLNSQSELTLGLATLATPLSRSASLSQSSPPTSLAPPPSWFLTVLNGPAALLMSCYHSNSKAILRQKYHNWRCHKEK